MKKIVAVLCAVAMTLTMGIGAFANPSLTGVVDHAKVVEGQESKLPQYTIPAFDPLSEDDVKQFKSEKVQEAVSKLNSATESITVAELLELLGVKLSADGLVDTTNGEPIDPLEYDPIMQFYGFALQKDNELSYDHTFEGGIEIELEIDALRYTESKDYVAMLLDPYTGDVYFIELDDQFLDPRTGTIRVNFPFCGPFTILEKTTSN